MHFKHTSTRYMQRNSLLIVRLHTQMSNSMLLLENMQQYIVTRNKGAINSTQNRISLLKVCHVQLYWSSSILQDIYFLYRIRQFVSELIEYGCINTRKSSASIPQKLHYCQRAKTWWTWRIRSVVAENNSMLKSRLSCVQWKFTTPDQSAVLIKILHFFLLLKYSPVSKW